MGQVWHLPVASQGSTRSLVEALASAHGSPVKFRLLPTWAVKALGLFVAPIGAMVEMLYQWEMPFLVDDSKFRTTFGIEATPLEEAAERSAAAWRVRKEAA